MRLLVLYTEMASYFYSCLECLVDSHDVDVLLVNWPVNKIAPFVFREQVSIRQVCKTSLPHRAALLDLCVQFEPDMVYTAGWMDKDYLFISRYFRKKGRAVILGSDTKWAGTLKQRVAALVGPVFLQRIFSAMWVPGRDQYVYARRLGFAEKQLAMGLYSADQPLFYDAYRRNRSLKKNPYPRTFIYIGRLSPEKGIMDLMHAFRSIAPEKRNGWKLAIYGVGPLKEQIVLEEGIHHHDFIQPSLLAEVLSNSGCLVLPSHSEPWGVVVHESCSAGLPLILSDHVGAASVFLRQGENGYEFKAGDRNALQFCLERFMAIDDDNLWAMSERSAALSFQLTPQKWVAELLRFSYGSSGEAIGA